MEKEILEMLASMKEEMVSMREEMNKRFDSVDKRFNEVDKRFNEVESELGEIKDRLHGIVGPNEEVTIEKQEAKKEFNDRLVKVESALFRLIKN